MRKLTCLSISLLCFFSLFLFASSFASADYQTARQDYVFQYSRYRDSQNQFQIAKSTFQTYGTLTSQNSAIAAFRTTVKIRDQVIAAYYDLLQEKLNNTVGITPDYQNTFGIIKQNEKNWLAAHQTKIDAAASLEDLNNVSAEFDQHFPQFDRETKQAIGMISLTKEANLKIETDATIASLSARISTIRQDEIDTSLWDRGMITVNNKLNLYSQKYANAHDIFFPKDNGSQIDIHQGEARLYEANQYLRETMTYIMEIIKSITG